jgi:D-xylose 1-dehydrogenase (NADP+, D-xylono-1,5-lactone-forming)
MSTRFRWGIMGTGNIAKQFAAGVNASELSALQAVGSRTHEAATKFATDFQVPVSHGSYDELIRDPRVEAIYISMPNTLHYEWTIKALVAGKHVLCEKPLACTSNEATEMYATAMTRGLTLVEAFMYRAHPQTQAVLDTIASGAIGNVKLIRTSFCYRVRQWEGNVRFDPTLAGGALMDVGCYCIDFSNLIAGDAPVEVRAVSKKHQSGVDEQTSVVMKYGNGITAEFTCGMMVQQDNTASICGEEGYITIGWPWKPSPGNAKFDICHSIPPRQDASQNVGQKVGPPPRQTIDVPVTKPLYAIEADAFARVVRKEIPSFVTPNQSIATAKILEQIRKSM